jgi:putative glutamine amidotransferase
VITTAASVAEADIAESREGSGGAPRRPLIGLTAALGVVQYGSQPIPGHIIPEIYLAAVWSACGQPVVIATGLPPEAAPQYLDLLDGLILTGGGDVNPARYGRECEELTLGVSDSRDAMELALARRAIARRLPVLAICRGIQVLNVALGGTLVQDLVTAGRDDHRTTAAPPTRHEVQISPGSLLAEVMGVERLDVNSLHHQAVDDLGLGLQPSATAPDGTVEAIEMDEPGWALGVQWHPELMCPDEPIQRRLFQAHVAQAAGYAARRASAAQPAGDGHTALRRPLAADFHS